MRVAEYFKRTDLYFFVQKDELTVKADPADKRTKLLEDPRSFQVDGYWHVYPIAIRPVGRKDGAPIHIVCPGCGHVHEHGWSRGDRAAHCDKIGGYVIEGYPDQWPWNQEQ